MDGIPDYKFNIKLAKAVKKYPLLYNTDLKEATIRDCRERAWIEVADELNCDPKFAQRKWKCCRTILVRKLRQIQTGETTKQYYLYNYIKYLIPYLKKTYEPGTLKRTLTESLQQINEEADTKHLSGTEHGTKDIEMVDDLTESSDELDENNDVSSDNEAGTDVENYFMSIPQHSEPTENIVVTDGVTNCTPLQHTSKSVISEQRDQTESQVESECPKRLFLLSLLPDLNEMTNSQMRRFKCKVLQLIDGILNENNTFKY
ncbi:uncharacterized protein LOC105215001 [Zeugodacus cucurbitae]|uniref:30S ribosomal protein S2 n=1 Tax=Zeugodacus cucurbitae TaxID=28588 RepID=A0A0A1X218_ZEUCU|nr:uncharacterized protein LOC105215001 [Zeugodacus cucurbitae]